MWNTWECSQTLGWSPRESLKSGVTGCCGEVESVDKVEWEDKVEKVETQECSVDVDWKE